MKKFNKKQQGFSVLAIILTIVAIIVALGVWMISGNSNTSSLGSMSSNVEATNIMNQAASLQSAYSILQSKGYTKDNILVINDPQSPDYLKENNIYNPNSSIEVPIISPKAFHENLKSTEGYWVFNFVGVNVDGRTDRFNPSNVYPSVLIAGIKDSVCKSINQSIKNNPMIPKGDGVIDSRPIGSEGITLGATKKLPISTIKITLTNIGMYAKWSKGCFNASIVNQTEDGLEKAPDQNVYFHFLE